MGRIELVGPRGRWPTSNALLRGISRDRVYRPVTPCNRRAGPNRLAGRFPTSARRAVGCDRGQKQQDREEVHLPEKQAFFVWNSLLLEIITRS